MPTKPPAGPVILNSTPLVARWSLGYLTLRREWYNVSQSEIRRSLMTTTHQKLIKQITDEARSLPENLMQEVLDFIGYLRAKYEQNGEEAQQEALLATFGSWQGDREPEEIVQDI